MDRVELKEKAKKMIVGKKWYILKPLVFFELIIIAVALCSILPLALLTQGEGAGFIIFASFISAVISFLELIFLFGYTKYCLFFVRGKELAWTETFKFGLDHISTVFVISLLLILIILVGSILLVVPAIIASIGLMYVQEVYVDNSSLGAVDTIKKAWDLTNGHKMDLFILSLSFIGWNILAALTFDILYIWLAPYMIVTFMLAYEKLKKEA